MIVLYLFLAGALLASPSWAALTTAEFEEYLEPTCFSPEENDKTLINGQEHPLAQTLENFISLAEKLEAANPSMRLREELFYFIRNYTYDNIEFSNIGDVQQWNPKGSDFTLVETLWEPDDNLRPRFPDEQDPFTEGEKCSLLNMLSHSIFLKPRVTERQRSMTNHTKSHSGRVFVLEEQYPMEMGVVAIRGTESAVALGKVLTGMYVGLSGNRKRNTQDIEKLKKQENISPVLDSLYTLTMAEVISLSTWRAEAKVRENLAPDGRWVSANVGNDLDTKDVCPMIYKLKEGINSSQSSSSLRGAADGFILGRIVDSVVQKRSDVKLSQILRMYYSKGGISGRDEELGQIWASFCNRENIISPLEQTLKEQVLLYQLIVSTSSKESTSSLDHSWKHYQEQKSSIFGNYRGPIADYCTRELSVEKPEELPLESPLDVIVVLDTSDGGEIFRRQQMITAYFANEMDLSYSGSRMTILTDQKAAATASGAVVLEPILTDSYSTACAACTVSQLPSEESPRTQRSPEDEVIIGIDQLLQAKKDNETRQSGVRGKVVIYFNLKEEQITAKPTAAEARLDKALRELHLRHIDVPMYALGRAQDFVKKYARNDIAFVMSAVDEPEEVVGKKLFQRVIRSPAALQYSGCEDGKGENGAIYEDFVSLNAVQHWGMPARYFYKSRNLKFIFESFYGPIKVCHGRSSNAPELEKKNCEDVATGQKIEFRQSNPCKSLNDVSCPPFFFSVMGVNVTDGTKQDVCLDANNDNKCRTLDQVKFKVSHDGVRCSGSFGLVAAPFVLVLTFALQYVLTKKY